MANVSLAKWLMRKWEIVPSPPTVAVGELQEVFQHPMFTQGSEDQRRAIMLESARNKYDSELAYPWDHYFGVDLRPLLAGKRVLDLGCFNGGRGVAWCERYGLAHLSGIDVDQVYIDAARQFAALKQVQTDYQVAVGERLPFEDAAFDAVLTFDVFEHVQDLAKTLAECRRVLKPGGKLYVVFPSFYQPIEHHLSMVTRFPGLHWCFSARTLLRAYCEILAERGEASSWYRRESPEPRPWEKGNTINGTTLSEFERLVRASSWKVVLHSLKPIGSIGRNISRKPGIAILTAPLALLTRVPGLREIVLHRNTFILEKTG
jgi:SAM-dependent methyltransferase